MARYIDADALLNELKEELEFDSPMYNEVENKWLNKGLRIAINDVKRFSTADVAPRAEVAREIFEGIEKIGVVRKIIKDGEIIFDVTAEYNELKKKYTEGGQG